MSRRASWILPLIVTVLGAPTWAQQPAAGPSIAKAELIGQLLGKGAQADVDAFEITVRRWQQRYWVVLVRGLQRDNARLAALGLYGDGEAPIRGHLIASSGTLALEEREEVVGLDLAPFRVTGGKTAIGIRFWRTASYSGGGEGGAKVLRLYLQRDKRLSPILSAVTDYECEISEPQKDGTRDHHTVSGAAVLAVSKQKTEGFFDLIKRSGRKTVAVYQWDGAQYVSSSSGRYGTGIWGGDCEVALE